MRLVIAEKPSMGRSIAHAIGLTGSGRHAISGRDAQGQDVVVTWCVGHLVEAVEPDTYDPSLKSWRMSGLPFLPETFRYCPNPATMDQWQAVRSLLVRDDVSEVVNATDAGREGQLIFHLVYDLAGCNRPVWRLWTSSLTDDAIRQAWQGMKLDSTYNGLTDAARCRQEADWLVGINCTRAQTLVARSQGAQGVYSIGRVQTPTLAIIAGRDQEIAHFVPKDFWTLIADFDVPDSGARYPGKWFRLVDGKEQDRLYNQQQAQALADQLRDRPGKIESVVAKNERRKAELLYDLTALQKECNRRFKWTAEHTLEVAQQLYEGKLISYPRTNSRHLTQADAQKAPAWLQSLQAGPWGEFVQEIQAMGKGRPPPLSKRFVDDTQVEDHSAIVVTEKAPPVRGGQLDLPTDQARLYDLVARRLVAAWYPDRVEARTTIITRVEDGDQGQTFKTTGAVEKQAGWTRVDPPRAGKKDDTDVQRLPEVRKNQKVHLAQVQAKAGKTTPPKPLNEADLLTAMQGAGRELDDEELRGAMKDCGLGTPATRAAIIETLLQRGYIARESNNVRATEKGLGLIASIHVDALTSPLLTGQWEADLNRMRRGEHGREKFMSDIRLFVQEVVEKIRVSAQAQAQRTAQSQTTSGGGLSPAPLPAGVLGPCPRCRSNLLLRAASEKHFATCSAILEPKCRVSYDCDDKGHWLVRCPHCTGPMSGRGICQHCGRTAQWEEDKPSWPAVAKCDQCKGILRILWSTKKSEWLQRCDRCDAWLNAREPSSPRPLAPECPGCHLPMGVLWSERSRRWYVLCQGCQQTRWV